MSQSAIDRLNRVKHQYDRGMLSTHEYPVELVRCAAYLDFAEFLNNLPHDKIENLASCEAETVRLHWRLGFNRDLWPLAAVSAKVPLSLSR